ncbi:MAG: methylated-DNA--[protein]-cysteine S-methyltransferase [candidate division Zixibacteria bacterium]|nr:methylated-DNA--[protein]-cysteine S-methyltransferase [candidate division Zixibacteria bacterium]
MNLYIDSLPNKDLGIINFGSTENGLRILSTGRYSGLAAVLEHGVNHGLPRIENSPKTKVVKKQLIEYFQGKRKIFDLELDLDYMPPFKFKALQAAFRIPHGQVITYGDLAEMAGSPKAARAAGQAMATNPIPLIIPCHRVVGSNGRLTGFGLLGGVEIKKRLLQMEGVAFKGDRVVLN